MIELETRVKQWGNSLAIILPTNKIKGMNIRAGKSLRIMIPGKSINLRKEFGSLKHILKKSAQEIKDSLRKEEIEVEEKKWTQ